jgi:NAD(P)-dependent dehydrogenase (short-subunit alcohol dehydrogenase family)
VAEQAQRVAIVTGGTRGIGAAVVGALTAAGLAVASFDVQPPADPGPGHGDRAYLTVDVSRAGQVRDAVGAVAQRFGRIDVLVNNAGILDVHAVHDTPEDTWDRVMAVNVKSVFLMSQAVIPHLKAAGGGSIVNISSVHAIATVPRLAAYAASKGAVLSLSRQMALDYADDGIRVNAVVVGGVDTQMSAEHGAAMARDGITVAPGTGAIGRSAQPGEVARAVAFLASPESSFLTGAPLIADGGMLARLF